jgi:colanic acid biosynthesis glycosyl transferase WcaI
MVVVSPPLLLGAAAWILSVLKRCPFVLHVQDLQPDAASGLGMLHEGSLLRCLRKLERFAYAKAARVSGITAGFLRSFREKNVPTEKLILFPNGTEIPDFWRLPEKGKFREAHGYSKDDLLVVYSGNVGRKQGLELILEAAARVKNPHLRFVICGDGANRLALERLATQLQLQSIRFFPLLPELRFHELMVDADLCVIPQQAGGGRCFFPSKLLKALAFSRPIFAVADPSSELAEALRDGLFGVLAPPGDPSDIAKALDAMVRDPENLRHYGRAGFKFVKRFEQSALLDRFALELEQTFHSARA